MGRIIVSEFLTLDGVMEASEEWQPPYVSDDLAEEIQAPIHTSEEYLLGRVTYQLLAAYWPLQTNNEFGIADKLNSSRKYVVSSTLEKAEWNNSTVIKGNPEERIRAVKQQSGGNIIVFGSATLVQSLTRAGLIDEFRLLVHPIVLGRGKRLFESGVESTGLKLIEAKPFTSGVVLLRYQVAEVQEQPKTANAREVTA